MGSSYIRVPIEALSQAGAALQVLSQQGQEVMVHDLGLLSLIGSDSVSGNLIDQATMRFQTDWDASRMMLLGNMELLGVVAQQIAENFQEFDAAKAAGVAEFAASFEHAGSGGAGGSAGGGGGVFAFDEALADEVEYGILATREQMDLILKQIRSSVEQLRPLWQGAESEQYYQIVADLDKAADAVVSVLFQVAGVVHGMRTDTQGLRGAVREVLLNSN